MAVGALMVFSYGLRDDADARLIVFSAFGAEQGKLFVKPFRRVIELMMIFFRFSQHLICVEGGATVLLAPLIFVFEEAQVFELLLVVVLDHFVSTSYLFPQFTIHDLS